MFSSSCLIVAAVTALTLAAVPQPSAAAPAGCTLKHGVDYNGFDLTGAPGWGKKEKTADLCAASCLGTPGCEYFTYVWGNCYLKTSGAGAKAQGSAISGTCLGTEQAPAPAPAPAPVDTPARAAVAVDTAAVAEAPAASGCTLMPDTDLWGADLPKGQHKAATAAACMAMCLGRHACTHFTFIWKTCYLKSSDAGRQDNKHGVSGSCTKKGAAAAEPAPVQPPAPPATAAQAPVVLQAEVANVASGVVAEATAAAPAPPASVSAEPVVAATEVPPAAAGKTEDDTGGKTTAYCIHDPRHDYPGAALEGTGKRSAPSAQHCAAICQDTEGCTHFTFTRGSCWLKTSSAGRKAAKKASSGFCVRLAPETTDAALAGKFVKLGSCCKSSDDSDKDTGSVIPVSECHSACAGNDECVAFDIEGDVCRLHVSAVTAFEPAAPASCSCYARSALVTEEGSVGAIKEEVHAVNKQAKAHGIVPNPAPPPQVAGQVHTNGKLTLSVRVEHDLAKMKKNIYEAQGAATGGKLYVFGGFVNGFRRMTKDTNVYDPSTDAWSQVAPMPASHDGITHTANAVDENQGVIYIVGGLANRPGLQWPKGAYATKTTWAYNTKTDKWSTLPDLPEARGGGAAVVLNKKLHFFNGASFEGTLKGFQKDFADHWALDLTFPERGWRKLASNAMGRNHLGGVVWGGKIYAIGGQYLELEGCSNQQIVEAYNPRTNTWARVADLPLGVGHISPSTLKTGKGIIVVGGAVNKDGGCNPPGTHRKQLLFYNPDTDKWTDLYSSYAGGSMVSGIIGGHIYAQHGKGVGKITLSWKGQASALLADGEASDDSGNADASTDADADAATAAAITAVVCVACVLAVMLAAVYAKRRMRSAEGGGAHARASMSSSATSHDDATILINKCESSPAFAAPRARQGEFVV